MKFIRGMVVGTLISAGVAMMINDGTNSNNKKKMIKKGRQFVRKLGIV